ncbi:DNA polymerase III subunit delta [Thermosulfurimonas sp.]|uniref:DNA polymerase III subunit delta n=1 Tax=Thermosulfurimonas sp. TaxID=2080236 RepID=UPI0025F6F24B|nr:hypothetical protein [Thermosulfurimonas sp.]
MPVFAGSHFRRLLDLARRDRLAPLYLFIGDPQETLEKAGRIVRIQEEKGALCERVDLEEVSPEDLRSLLVSPGLFGPRRLVMVRKAEILAQHKEQISPLLEPLGSGTVHLFLLASRFPEDHPLYTFALERGALVPLHLQKGRARFLAEMAERLSAEGYTMDRQVAEYFLSLVGEDYAHFRNELEKVLLYAGEKERIEKEDVEAVVTPAPETYSYLLGDTLLEEGAEAARGLLRRLLDQGDPPLVILAILENYFKRLWLLAYLFRGREDLLRETRFEVFQRTYAQALRETWPEKVPSLLERFPPYAAFRVKRHLFGLSPGFFPEVFKALYELDVSLKRDFMAPEKAFYRFFLRVQELGKKF